MSSRRVLTILQIVFLARGLFYAVVLPMWEGFDEWAHFAYAQHMATAWRLPSRYEPVQEDVRRSLLLLPLAYGSDAARGGISHDDFWRLPQADRDRRALSLESNTGAAAMWGANQYEAQHPPLYYGLAGLALAPFKSAPLAGRALLLRVLNIALASFLVWIVYALARRLHVGKETALACSALVALWPGLLITVCRAGNEALAIVLSGLAVLCATQAVQRVPRIGIWAGLGVLLAFGLLTKAYALPLLVLIPSTALACQARRAVLSKTLVHACAAMAVALGIGGWWYLRTFAMTGSVIGEQTHALSASNPLTANLQLFARVNIVRLIDSAAFTHIWVGGWSFLTVRSWMYRAFELIVLTGVAGAAVAAIKAMKQRRAGWSTARSGVALCAVLALCAALYYHGVVLYAVTGVLAAPGWYLYPVFPAGVALLAFALRSLLGPRAITHGIVSICLLALMFDLYTVHFHLIPYYTGLIAHSAEGTLRAFHAGRFLELGLLQEITVRLSWGETRWISPSSVVLLWLCYLTANLTAALLMLWRSVRRFIRSVRAT